MQSRPASHTLPRQRPRIRSSTRCSSSRVCCASTGWSSCWMSRACWPINRYPPDPNVAIVGNSCGPGILAAGAADAAGLVVVVTRRCDIRSHRRRSPGSSLVPQPSRPGSGGPSRRGGRSVRILLDADEIDAVITVFTETFVRRSRGGYGRRRLGHDRFGKADRRHPGRRRGRVGSGARDEPRSTGLRLPGTGRKRHGFRLSLRPNPVRAARPDPPVWRPWTSKVRVPLSRMSGRRGRLARP